MVGDFVEIWDAQGVQVWVAVVVSATHVRRVSAPNSRWRLSEHRHRELEPQRLRNMVYWDLEILQAQLLDLEEEYVNVQESAKTQS